MKKFNLQKHYLDEILAYTRQETRENYNWWDYDQLRSGGDETWNRFVSMERSLVDALQDAGVDRQSRLRSLQRIYGLPPSELGKIFKTYIGYHPAYGAYICHIGPYMGTKFAEADNKFSFYVKRKRRCTEEEVSESIEKNIAKYMTNYGVDLDISDMQFVIKEPTTFDPNKKRQKKLIREVVVNLDPDSPEGRDFYERAPIAPKGSEFGVNAKGLEKIIRTKWPELYQEAIREKAAEEGISEREVINMQLRDLDFLKRIYDRVRRKYQESVRSGEAALSGQQAPPSFLDLSLKGVSGQEQFSTVVRNSLLKRRILLRQEVLEVLNEGIQDPQEITSRLNSRASRNSNPIPQNEVDDILETINAMSTQSQELEAEPLSYETLMQNTASEIEGLDEKKGFDDLKTAFEMAKVYFTNLPVDPQTKGKMQLKYAPKMVFDPPEYFENITSADLERLKNEKSEADRGQLPSEVATEEEIEEQLGDQVVEQETSENLDEDVETTETNEAPEEYNAPAPPTGLMKDLFGNTLVNLITLAEELDNENKESAAEEIHKVIRKYQERI